MNQKTNSTTTIMPTPITTPQPTPTPSPVPTPTPAPVSTTGAHTITIQNFAFSQSSITIKKGDSIAWVNNDAAPHTVTGDTGGLSSGTLNTGQTYNHTFDTAGSFAYHCNFHPSMIGTVTVTN